jgi:hypothetical protein
MSEYNGNIDLIERITNLKMITKIFILAQLLDVVTTYVAITSNIGLGEMNPIVDWWGWEGALLYKFLYDALVVYVFQKFDTDKYKIFWIVNILPVLAVISNTIVICVAFYLKYFK